jgi:hypothetical protein
MRLGLSAVAAMGLLSAGALAQPSAVLELFTSQGCSSCPPADALLGEYAERDDVLALSFAVDYWDYLGWKDTLAKPENSDRQRGYAAARGDREVYTPQMVVNGATHMVGSNRGAVERAVNEGLEKGLPVPITLTSNDDATTVNVGAAPGPSSAHANLWLVMYERAVTVPIDRGENGGRTITYSNVVKKLRPIAMWKGEAMSVDLPKSELAKAKAKRCAVILQAEKADGVPGQIMGAAKIEYDR